MALRLSKYNIMLNLVKMCMDSGLCTMNKNIITNYQWPVKGMFM